MSAPDLANILRVPGKLSHSPTSTATLQQAYPHGGTALGLVGKVTPRLVDPPFIVTAAEFGGAPIDLIERGPSWVLDFELREFEAAALAAIFPFYATGAKGGPVLKFNAGGAVRGGFKMGSVLSFVLVFTPDNPDEHPMLIIRRAVPSIQETATLALAANRSVAVPARFYATPDSNKDVLDYGLRRDLAL